MKPTLGRIVHWTDGQGWTFAAVIAAVESDTDVILTVFDFGSTVAGVRAKFGAPGRPKTWYWPPRAE